MSVITETYAKPVPNTCKHCGSELVAINPNKKTVRCCSVRQRHTLEDYRVYKNDNGRDNKGRFHHKPERKLVAKFRK